MKSLYPLILLSALSVVAVAAAGESTKGEGDKKKGVAASTVYSFARNVDYNEFLLKGLYSELSTEDQYRILGKKFAGRRITQEEIRTDVTQVLATKKSFGPMFLAVLTKKTKEQICEDITNALMKCAQVDKVKEK